MALSFRFVTFLSDYGLDDEFVGVCRGVMKRFAPDVDILDISHGIPPQDIRAGALVLGQAVRYMPAAVHLAVVDPGVGTSRRAVVIGTASGPPLIGPDNGLLGLAAETLGGATQAYSISNSDLWLQQPSRTFHGRDIFAPVAARLAMGMPPEEVGEPVPVDELVQLPMQPAKIDDDHIHARVILCDHFGNLQLNVHRHEIEGIGVLLGDRVEIRVGGRSYDAVYGQAFSEAPLGGLVVLEDSYRWLVLAAYQANAEKSLNAIRGDAVILARIHQVPHS